MSRKVYVDVKVRLVMDVDEGVEISEIIDEMEYEFFDTTTKATIEDTSIENWEITDSK